MDSSDPVYCGVDFWEHLTGDRSFYYRLTKAFGEVVEEDDTEGKHMLIEVSKNLSQEIVSYLKDYAVKD